MLIVGLGQILTVGGAAQTCTSLHAFANGDGANPTASLILSGETLYGTTFAGGSSGNGTVFAVNINGSDFTNLYNFTTITKVYKGTYTLPGSNLPWPLYVYTNSDGSNPKAGLILSGNTLYGTASAGGSSNAGTLFAINTDGTGFTNLYSFTGGNDGADPAASLILSGNTLYGTTAAGGSSDHGTIFSFNTDGRVFRNLYSFTAGSFRPLPVSITNSDGAVPVGSLILSGSTLFGTASGGGIWGAGTVFAINTNGLGFTNLYNFTGGNDGGHPRAGLILSSNTLYGTTRDGGDGANGTVFAVGANGLGFTNLYSFTADYTGSFLPNADGANPLGSLILTGNTLYGTTSWNGNPGVGTVFAINTDGSDFTVLHRFNGSNGVGWEPAAGLVLSGHALYGTTDYGGSSDNGTVFSLSLPTPYLTIIYSATNVVLTWQNDASGVTLQSSTNLLSPVAWKADMPSPSVSNGQSIVTSPISGPQRFFRLSQ